VRRGRGKAEGLTEEREAMKGRDMKG